MGTLAHSKNCYEWTIGQWEQVPKPLVPKTCTTLVPQGTIVAGAVRTDNRCYEEANGQWDQVPTPLDPKTSPTLAPKGPESWRRSNTLPSTR